MAYNIAIPFNCPYSVPNGNPAFRFLPKTQHDNNELKRLFPNKNGWVGCYVASGRFFKDENNAEVDQPFWSNWKATENHHNDGEGCSIDSKSAD